MASTRDIPITDLIALLASLPGIVAHPQSQTKALHWNAPISLVSLIPLSKPAVVEAGLLLEFCDTDAGKDGDHNPRRLLFGQYIGGAAAHGHDCVSTKRTQEEKVCLFMLINKASFKYIQCKNFFTSLKTNIKFDFRALYFCYSCDIF